MGYSAYKNASANCEDDTIFIIDPGHGGEDPGAVANGLFEKNINLDISSSFYILMRFAGRSAVMTHDEDKMMYNPGEEARKKYYDLSNRVLFADKYNDPVFISIHINKFVLPSCKGIQTFYSPSDDRSQLLAASFQENAKILQPNNNRNIKTSENNIFLLDNLKCTAVLIECGFISNAEEASNLKETDYKNAIAVMLCCGVADYLEKLQ